MKRRHDESTEFLFSKTIKKITNWFFAPVQQTASQQIEVDTTQTQNQNAVALNHTEIQTTSIQAASTSNMAILKHPQHPNTSSGYNYFEYMPTEIINHIFQYIHLPRNLWLREVNKKFNYIWGKAAEFQLISSPSIRHLVIERGFEKLIADQKAEIEYLIDNKAAIIKDNINICSELNHLFDKLNSSLENPSMIIYFAKEKCLNDINEIIIKEIIALHNEHCSNCIALDLTRSHLTRLPDALFNDETLKAFWSQIVTIHLSHNSLTTLPDAISQCTRLKDLLVDHNRLTSLPRALHQCAALRLLNITKNNFSALPDDLSESILYGEQGKINKAQCLASQKKPLIENIKEKQEQMRFH